MGLADVVGDLIEDFETAHQPLPDITGVQALKFLMQQHGLKQSAVRKEFDDDDCRTTVRANEAWLDYFQFAPGVGKLYTPTDCALIKMC